MTYSAMQPETRVSEEGNSVDPPGLPSQGQGDSALGSLETSACLNITASTCVNNGAAALLESSATGSTRTCVGSLSDGVEKISTFVVDRYTHTTSISANGNLTTKNESNCASAPTRGVLDICDEEIHSLAKDTLTELTLAPRSGSALNIETEDSSDLHLDINAYEPTANDSLESQESDRQRERPTLEEPPSVEFTVEQAKMAYRLKPQLTSEFLTKEIDTIPPAKINVDSILRKYGLESKKYESPLAMSGNAHGDTLGTDLSLTSTATQSSYSSRKLFSMTDTNADTQSHSPLKGVHSPLPLLESMNLSQNNEALSKLIDPQAEPIIAENKKLELTPGFYETAQRSISSTKIDPTNTDPTKPNQETFGVSQSSTNIDPSTDHDSVKNVEVLKAETLEKEKKLALIAAQLSAAHGSSVDMALSDHTEGNLDQESLGYGGPYSGLRAATSVVGYASPYGGKAGSRTGGFVISSRPSNMDVSPFDGSYLKSHLSMPRYSSITGVGGAPTDMGGFSVGTSKESMTPSAHNLTGINSDSLDYSLQQERYRLRGIDNLITSGAGRISGAYSAMPYSMSYRTPINSPGTFSHRNSATGAWSKTLSSTPSYEKTSFDKKSTQSYHKTSFDKRLYKKPSHDRPSDIAAIRRAGSSVDTGQFNNNRGSMNYGYRSNRYGSEIALRLGVQEAWATDSPATANNLDTPKVRQQQSTRKPGSRNTDAAGENFILRNRLAVSKKTLSSEKMDHPARDKKSGQRPKSAKGAGLANRGSNFAHQRDKSHSAVPVGFDFGEEFNRILETSILEKGNAKDRSNISNTNRHIEGKSSSTVCCKVIRNINDSGEGKNAEPVCMRKGIQNPKMTQPNASKYQPYLATATGNEERQQNYQGQAIDEDQSVSGSVQALSKSSSRATRSQDSCSDITSEAVDLDSHCFPKYDDFEDESERNLVTATALASALIHKRQKQLENLQMFLQGSCSVTEGGKHSDRAGLVNSSSIGGSSAQKLKSRGKKNPKSARPSSASASPYANIAFLTTRKSNKCSRK